MRRLWSSALIKVFTVILNSHVVTVPFFPQVCNMYFMLTSASASYMQLVPVLANYTGKTRLIEYSIGE